MLFSDNRCGKNFAKDPAVVYFKNTYFMYYSTMAEDGGGFRIGIACSADGADWEVVGQIPVTEQYEKNGIAAPGAIVLGNKVHLFYQTYGNREKDAICHAWSEDGLVFEKNPCNPIFHPTDDWCCGRAIDADVCLFKGKLFLYTATRDHSFTIQKLAVAAAELSEDGSRFREFHQLVRGSVLYPELKWEQDCIEAPASLVRNDTMYLFYGGAYNCAPQQIGCASSKDGRMFDKLYIDNPLIPKGEEGSWNASESGHPFAFQDVDERVWLYYQGSPDNGNTWYLSRVEIGFGEDGIPYVKIPPLIDAGTNVCHNRNKGQQ